MANYPTKQDYEKYDEAIRDCYVKLREKHSVKKSLEETAFEFGIDIEEVKAAIGF